ncbi:acylase [Altererythrobacter arenosus]|uniref:Acylase n=1 Tax=Altererythrobacter arenosus TaxID=3032592 RepID=A0ABY8FTH5_9SPHN|nr:acylase [Altererythrobacter sp. CAU 1644]WFL78067.1 acylase [Altererythrobacter sp. CAU 1644]
MFRKWLSRIGFALLILFIAAFVALATWEPFLARQSAPPPEREYQAEIIRDSYGVPHIYGETDADVAFGVAIAHSEDDFSTLQDVIAMAKGRYGAIAGQDGAAIDFVYHLLDARGTAERHYPNLPADTQALFDAYASGLNQYAEDHPGELKLANLFPVNGPDVAAGFALRQPFFFGLNGVIQPLVTGEPMRREFGPDIPGYPRNEAGEVVEVQAEADDDLAYSPFGADGALSGSNAFAVAPEKSGGPTVLISNSHQPLRGGVAWYELVVESGEGWHYAGANFPGSPYPFLGHNENLGWTNTVNRPDLTDVYRLEMDESGTKYRLDGEWRALESTTVTLPVKLGPITLPIRRTVHRSVHGPVIFNHTGVYAIRYGGIDNIDQLDAYYRLNKAKNLDEWQAQLARLDVPSTNFIYADKAGNIAYVYNAAIPDRPEGYNWRGVLPGDDSKAIWRETVDYAALPKLINPASGWLYNSNNEPYTAAGPGSDLDPDDFAPILGIEEKQTNRSRRAWKLLSEASLLNRETLRRIKYDTAYEREGYVGDLWDALERLDLPNGSELAKARDLLLQWDFTADSRGGADALALLMIKDFMSAEYQNKPLPDVRDKLEWAVGHLEDHFGRIDPPMSELLRLRQGDVDLPLDGGSDTLRASTTWRIDEDGRLGLVHGDSFIQWVEWAEGERVLSRSIQPFGSASTRPDSPHYTDQMQLFVEHKLKPVHFWRDDVLANAARRYTVRNR